MPSICEKKEKKRQKKKWPPARRILENKVDAEILWKLIDGQIPIQAQVA
jgi:hypothetical protein